MEKNENSEDAELLKLNNEWKNLKVITEPNSEIWTHNFREEIKDLGWRLMRYHRQRKNFYHAAFYLLHGVISSHYWRAREAIENNRKCKSLLRKIRGKNYYPGYQLDIEHYVSHWLGANGDRRDLFPIEVVRSLEEEFYFKAEKNKYLPSGMTNYQGFEYEKK